MNKNKLLVVYNTCGINRDNTQWYINCVANLLNQDFDGFRVVWSSCLNSDSCKVKMHSVFGDAISYSMTYDPITVNSTFNKAVDNAVEEFGEFEGYVYVDSGCDFGVQTDILSSIYSSFKNNEGLETGVITVQVDTDEALQVLGEQFLYQSSEVQIKGKDFVVPLGKGLNLHTAAFSNKIRCEYGKVLPDVFSAFCTESTFSFVAASVNTKWVVMADKQVIHRKAIDGPVASQPHRVVAQNKEGNLVSENCWNNLLCGRNALDFIYDKEAIEAGLGYEEVQEIMVHAPEAYENGIPLQQQKLISSIKKYFYLSKEEFDYSTINNRFRA